MKGSEVFVLGRVSSIESGNVTVDFSPREPFVTAVVPLSRVFAATNQVPEAMERDLEAFKTFTRERFCSLGNHLVVVRDARCVACGKDVQ